MKFVILVVFWSKLAGGKVDYYLMADLEHCARVGAVYATNQQKIVDSVECITATADRKEKK